MNEVSEPDRPSGSVSSNPRGHRVPADVGDRAPSVWVLAGSRAGDRAQLTGLATTLGWPFQVKQLKYNVLNLLPNLVLGASLSSLDKPRSDDLSPPWPDLILDCGRKSVPAARWIRAQSAGRSRWVHLGRPWAPLAWFDLVVATPQYRVPRRDNVIQITLPFHTITADRLAAASAGWDRRLDALPRPWIAALVGGGSTSHVFDASAAERLGKLLSEATAATGGSLLITTSPRTSDAVAAALQRSIRAPSHFHSWRDEGMGNPYLAFLALADRIVVTSDSASMIAEACATGKPVSLFELPLRRDVASKLLRAINQVLRRPGGDGLAEEPGTWRILPRQTFDRLVELGVFMPARDMAAYCQALVARGMINRLGEPSNTLGRQTQDDATKVVERICALMTMKRAGFS